MASFKMLHNSVELHVKQFRQTGVVLNVVSSFFFVKSKIKYFINDASTLSASLNDYY